MELIVVTFMRVDHGNAEVQCQWVDTDGNAICKQINEWFDQMSIYSGEELAEMEIERLTSIDDVERYVNEHANYFNVDVTRHTVSVR